MIDDPLSRSKKACFVTASTDGESAKKEVVTTANEAETQKLKVQIAEWQEALKALAKDPKAKKSEINTKVDLLCLNLKVLPRVTADLQYFLTLSEVLAGQVLLGLAEAPERFKAGQDLKSLYTTLL